MTASPYRTSSAQREVVVVPAARNIWLLLGVIPFVESAREWIMTPAALSVPDGPQGFCGNANHYRLVHAGPSFELMAFCVAAFVVAVAAVVAMVRSRPSAVLVVDRSARTLLLTAEGATHAYAFAERPVLVEREGIFSLHAGVRQPVVVATHKSPATAIARLRALLATLSFA